MAYKIENISAKYNREDFDCEEESLNDFLKRFARQNDDKGFGRTYVAVLPDDTKIYGYYTILSGAVKFDNLPEKLPRYPVPVIHLGRLAVDKTAKGHGLGKSLLFDALQRAANLAEQLGVFAVEVYALTPQAKEFYSKFGFKQLLDDELHLYITIKAIRKLLADTQD
jgi:GNAT superfamily N-acetyltransferase